MIFALLLAPMMVIVHVGGFNEAIHVIQNINEIHRPF